MPKKAKTNKRASHATRSSCSVAGKLVAKKSTSAPLKKAGARRLAIKNSPYGCKALAKRYGKAKPKDKKK